MEPIMKEKRASADFIPYRRRGKEWEFFLQKRDGNAPRYPNMIAIFGGALEQGETPEKAMRREVMEEMNYETTEARYFCVFETARSLPNVFIEEVGSNFESKVIIQEGEGGVFLTDAEVQESIKVVPFSKFVIFELSRFLNS